MSLRAIHIVFIAASIVLALLTAFWAVTMFQSDRGGTGHLVFAVGSLSVALGMLVYAVRFVRKTRELGLR